MEISGQSCKGSTIVDYDFRVVLTRKLSGVVIYNHTRVANVIKPITAKKTLAECYQNIRLYSKMYTIS